jgi:hypothetical protein
MAASRFNLTAKAAGCNAIYKHDISAAEVAAEIDRFVRAMAFQGMEMREITVTPFEPIAPPAWDPRSVKEGDYVVVTVAQLGTDNNDEENQIPAGEVWEVARIDTYPGQGLAITVAHPAGLTSTFDEKDVEPRFPFEPLLGKAFSVNVRAMCHLTATRYVDAANEDHAERQALQMARQPDFIWDRSDPEDINVESFN